MPDMGTRTSKSIGAQRSGSPVRQTSLKKRIKTWVSLILLGILSLLAIGAIYILVIFVQESKKLPSLTEIGNFKPTENTVIYYSDGKTIMAELASENRRPIKLDDMGKLIAEATVATEDSRFYEHGGVDMHGVVRAIFKNLAGGEMREGASTITQQLARNINELGVGREKKLRRKVAEAILAMRIEQTFSKQEILELYLNQIYYGSGAYGCEAAARSYFHKSSKQLTLGEASFIAGIPQRPKKFSEDFDAALVRRDWVLKRMVESGKITQTQVDDVRKTRLKVFKPTASGSKIYGAHYFVNYVMAQLIREYSQDAVYRGLKVITTLNPDIQKLAEQTMIDGIRHSNSANVGALICLDPKTGGIKAMVGGLDYKKSQFNIITQGLRQAGSCFKPVVYTAAFDTDVATLDKSYKDDPNLDSSKVQEGWRPKNYGGHYSYGYMSVRSALRNSVNTIAVKVALDTGIQTVIDYAHKLGITTKIEPYAPIALGAASVRPIELASVYCVFANNGKRALPMSITKVLDPNGDILFENTVKIDDSQLKAESIAQINEGLREVVTNGTGFAANAVLNAHGKTGTTSDNRDAWFSGYTPELVTVIWAGHENRNKKGKLDRKEPYLEMPGTTGGQLCTPIWRDFMMKAVPLQIAEVKRAATQIIAEKAVNYEKDNTEPDAPKQGNPKKLPTSKVPSAGVENNSNQETPVANPNVTVPTGDPSTADDSPTVSPTPTAPITSAPPSGVSTGVTPSTSIDRPITAPSSAMRTGAPRTVRPDGISGSTEPTGRLAVPVVRRVDPGEEVISVGICGDSGRKANKWCDTVVQRRMRRRDVPGLCRTHKAPPGEGNG